MLSGKIVKVGIPLIAVEGHDWRIYIVFQEDNGDIVSVLLAQLHVLLY
jgi:hypothetical protein